MDVLIAVILLIMLAAIVGGGLFFANDMRKSYRAASSQPVSLDGLKTELDARYQTEIERMRSETRGAVGEIEQELGRIREGLRTSAHEHDTQLARIRDRYVEVDGQTAVALERALGDMRSTQETELTRLRESVGAAMATLAARQTAPETTAFAARKMDAISGLYRMLARLETNFLSVTNPVLLPGESFSLPPEFLPETLKWESWKEVGDATFSFAEAFNQDRIYLDDSSCRSLSRFVSELREIMTTGIYPNLMVRPGVSIEESRIALRASIEQLGHEIPDARELLERSFRERE